MYAKYMKWRMIFFFCLKWVIFQEIFFTNLEVFYPNISLFKIKKEIHKLFVKLTSFKSNFENIIILDKKWLENVKIKLPLL